MRKECGPGSVLLLAGIALAAIGCGASTPGPPATTRTSQTHRAANPSTGWTLHRRAQFEIATPSDWTTAPASVTPPHVLLFAGLAPNTDAFVGVQVVSLPRSAFPSLKALTAQFAFSIQKQPVQGALQARQVRLPAGDSVELDYVVAPKGHTKLSIKEYLLVNTSDWAIAYIAPSQSAKHEVGVIARSANSFRALP